MIWQLNFLGHIGYQYATYIFWSKFPIILISVGLAYPHENCHNLPIFIFHLLVHTGINLSTNQFLQNDSSVCVMNKTLFRHVNMWRSYLYSVCCQRRLFVFKFVWFFVVFKLLIFFIQWTYVDFRIAKQTWVFIFICVLNVKYKTHFGPNVTYDLFNIHIHTQISLFMNFIWHPRTWTWTNQKCKYYYIYNSYIDKINYSLSILFLFMAFLFVCFVLFLICYAI